MAYKAVTKPKEGTILSVVRAMSEAATSMNKRNIDFQSFLLKVIDAGEEMLLAADKQNTTDEQFAEIEFPMD